MVGVDPERNPQPRVDGASLDDDGREASQPVRNEALGSELSAPGQSAGLKQDSFGIEREPKVPLPIGNDQEIKSRRQARRDGIRLVVSILSPGTEQKPQREWSLKLSEAVTTISKDRWKAYLTCNCHATKGDDFKELHAIQDAIKSSLGDSPDRALVDIATSIDWAVFTSKFFTKTKEFNALVAQRKKSGAKSPKKTIRMVKRERVEDSVDAEVVDDTKSTEATAVAHVNPESGIATDPFQGASMFSGGSKPIGVSTPLGNVAFQLPESGSIEISQDGGEISFKLGAKKASEKKDVE